jgi:single-stranded-DNA-specific exonuclease
LFNRGISTALEAAQFIKPDYGLLSDPFELDDMREAVEKIVGAVKSGKRIAIYGDYDVDGVTATALLVRFFKKIDNEVVSYIPLRKDEGYGLHNEAILELKKKGVDLIITVDCGTTAMEQVDFAKKNGLEIIITDHHALAALEGQPQLPNTLVINPKRQDRDKPYYNLAGVGVAFYLVRGLQQYFMECLPLGQEKWFLDLVAIGTVCDVVELTKDNRILASYGLRVLSKTRNIGLLSLAIIAEVNLDQVNTYKIGFVLGPRLNAAGRIEDARQSLELLTTEDTDRAVKISTSLDKLNTERQEITQRIVEEARELILSSDEYKRRKVLVLKNKDWPVGVVGIAASRLVEEFSKPVLIMEEEGDELKGSARSVGGFNIIEALNQCSECFLHYGGHSQAAGFKLDKDKFLLLDEKLIKISDDKIEETDLIPEVLIDLDLTNKIIDQKLVKNLSELEPYGAGNFKPVFILNKVTIKQANLVGADHNHLKLVLENKNILLNAIAFNYGDNLAFGVNDRIDIVFTLEINEWKNQKKVDLHIIDLKPSK